MSDAATDRGTDPCPACGHAIEAPEDVVLGEVLWCDSCGAELEVIRLTPFTVDLYEEEEK